MKKTNADARDNGLASVKIPASVAYIGERALPNAAA
jgi:hypothetical protein